jgi:Flp pilus assembly CpaE family ATPase
MQLGRACVVDLHGEEGHVAAHLQIAPAKSWHDLTHVTPSTDKRDIGSALTIHKSGVAVLASPTHQASEQLSEETLHVVYSVLGEGFKRAVVDLPPDFSNPMTLATLPQAGNVIAVVGDNPAALGTASAKLAALEELNLQGDIHVVINRTRPHGVTHEDVTTTLQRPVAADIPYEAEQVNAMMQGTPLLMAQPNSLFSRAILYLARQL